LNKRNTWIAGSAIGAVVLLAGAGIAIAITDPFDNDGPLTGATLASASEAALAEVGPGTVIDAEYNDDMGSEYTVEVRLENGATVDVELDESFDVVFVSAADWDEFVAAAPTAAATAPTADVPAVVPSVEAATPVTAEQAAANRASAEASALAQVGSGTVTDYEVSDDFDHVYEVEVTLSTGVDVDVELDANFVVLRTDGAVQ
jgi:uncharacterized membrane protein YkoI